MKAVVRTPSCFVSTFYILFSRVGRGCFSVFFTVQFLVYGKTFVLSFL